MLLIVYSTLSPRAQTSEARSLHTSNLKFWIDLGIVRWRKWEILYVVIPQVEAGEGGEVQLNHHHLHVIDRYSTYIGRIDRLFSMHFSL